MADEETIRGAAEKFPSLLKDLDEISLSQISHEMQEFEMKGFDIKNEKENELVGNTLYDKLKKKVLDTLSPALKRYGLVCNYDDNDRRWLSLKADEQYKIRFIILPEGIELQPVIVFIHDNNGTKIPSNLIGRFQICFPQKHSDKPREYRSYINVLYRFLESRLIETVEPAMDAVMLSRTQISMYPEDSLKVYIDGNDVRYELFGRYDVWAYMLGEGFMIKGKSNIVIERRGYEKTAF